MVSPLFSIDKIDSLLSCRFALNSKWMARSFIFESSFVKYSFISLPVFVLRSGNLMALWGMFFEERCFNNWEDCVDFPQRSIPSKTMKAPLFKAACAISLRRSVDDSGYGVDRQRDQDERSTARS